MQDTGRAQGVGHAAPGWRGAVAVAVALCLAVAACSSADPVAAPDGAPAGAAPPELVDGRPPATTSLANPAFRATPVGTAGSIPTGLVGPPGGKYLLVGSVTGQVDVVELQQQDGYTVPRPLGTPWLDLSDRTKFDGQNRGLLGLAMVDGGRRVAVSYTALDGAVTVETFPWNNRPTAGSTKGAVAIAVPHALAGLSGGGIAAMPDGDLVLGVGDMDDRFGSPPAAQDPASPLGSVIRIDRTALDGGPPVEFGPQQLVAKGLRNPWGISVDPDTSDIWLGDVGDAKVEEIDRIPGSVTPGRPVNFGWPWFEGSEAGVDGAPSDAALTSPVVELPHRYEVCSVVGGVVYHGRQLPGLEGAYLYGDLCSNKVRALRLRGGKVVERRTVGTISGKVVDFGTDADGEVYVLGLSGSVFRLDPATWKVPAATAAIGPPVSTPAAPGAPPGTGPPPAKCGIIDVFYALEPISTLTRTEVRQRLARVRELLDSAAASTTGPLRDDVLAYQQIVADWIEFGEERNWDFTDPDLAGYFGKVTSGSGQFAGAPATIDRLIAAVADCPGERL